MECWKSFFYPILNYTFAITKKPIKSVKMKKIFLKITICMACTVIATCCLYSQGDKNVTDLASSNIEALANGEGPGVPVMCLGRGSVECYGDKVEIKVTNYSLD